MKAKELSEKIDLLNSMIEMASLPPEKTGLPLTLWIRPEEGSQHGPRVKVSKFPNKARFSDKDSFSISISDTPKIVSGDTSGVKAKDLELIFSFIKNKKDSLLRFWNKELENIKELEKEL